MNKKRSARKNNRRILEHNRLKPKMQTTLLWSTVAVKLDSAFIKFCVCEKKSNFMSWAIRTVFIDPVTYHCVTGDHMITLIIQSCELSPWLF